MPLVSVQLFSATRNVGVTEARERIVDLLSGQGNGRKPA
jgi:hypothetical protein